MNGTGGFCEGLGFRPGVVFAAAAGLSEVVGGLLLVFGLFTPVGASAILAAMIVASISVHVKNGFFTQNNGYEPAFLYGAAALGIALVGPGNYSLDHELGLVAVSSPVVVTTLLVLAVVGALFTLVTRKQPATQPTAS